MSKLITFEGIEGSGKSTQLRLAAQYFAEKNLPVLATQEPSGTDIGRKIGDILFNRRHQHLCPEAEVFLFCAARAQHVREVITPALKKNITVLCDRFSDATIAYQGAARGLNLEMIKAVDEYSTLGLKPDLTLLFDLPPEAGLKRAGIRDKLLKDSSARDRFEKESFDFHNKVRFGYLNICQSAPERFRLIDASGDIETIQKEVQRHLDNFIGRTID